MCCTQTIWQPCLKRQTLTKQIGSFDIFVYLPSNHFFATHSTTQNGGDKKLFAAAARQIFTGSPDPNFPTACVTGQEIGGSILNVY
jgi:hypothetical protein